MPSVSTINGTNLRFYAGGLPVGYSTTCTLDMQAETISVIHKDSPGGGWAESDIGQKSATVSFEGFINEDSSYLKYGDLFTHFDNETLLGCAFKTTTSGDTRFDFSARLTSLSFTGTVEENSTFSGTATVSGAITKTTVT